MKLWIIMLLLRYIMGVVRVVKLFTSVGTYTEQVNRFYRLGYILAAISWPIIWLGVFITTIKNIYLTKE